MDRPLHRNCSRLRHGVFFQNFAWQTHQLRRILHSFVFYCDGCLCEFFAGFIKVISETRGKKIWAHWFQAFFYSFFEFTWKFALSLVCLKILHLTIRVKHNIVHLWYINIFEFFVPWIAYDLMLAWIFLKFVCIQIKTYYNPLKLPPIDQNFAPIFASFVKEQNDKCLEEDNNPVFEIRGRKVVDTSSVHSLRVSLSVAAHVHTYFLVSNLHGSQNDWSQVVSLKSVGTHFCCCDAQPYSILVSTTKIHSSFTMCSFLSLYTHHVCVLHLYITLHNCTCSWIWLHVPIRFPKESLSSQVVPQNHSW